MMRVLASVKLAPFLESVATPSGGGDAKVETVSGKRFAVAGGRANPDCAMSISIESPGLM